MNMPVAQNQTINANDNAFARLDLLFSQIPDHVYAWLFSEQAAKNVVALGKKFGLSDSQTIQMSRLTGLAILKELTPANMALELKKTLNLPDEETRQLTIDIALTQFLPIRDYLPAIEEFIKQLGANVPAILPPLFKPPADAKIDYKASPPQPGAMPTPIQSQPMIIQKSLRELVKDNKDALNQSLTGAPIKIADFNQPVRPTIKNWLVDYVKIKGAGHHESLERSDYLFNNVNARALAEEERALLAEILKAYDDDLSLPINSQDQTILLEKIKTAPANAQPQAKTAPAPLRATAPETTFPTLPRKEQLYKSAQSAPPIQPARPTNYREPISDEDLSGPIKPAPRPAASRQEEASFTESPKPAPRLSGNIIDLKDLQ